MSTAAAIAGRSRAASSGAVRAAVRRTLVLTVAMSALLAWPLVPGVPYDLLNTAVLACQNLIVVLSIVLLIGFVGQISLCQSAFVGMGAFLSAIFVNRFGVHFPFVLAVGVLAGAVSATVIGVVALRVRGLYLAVATLIFSYVCDQYLFSQEWLVQSQSGTSIPVETIGHPGAMPFFDLADAHVFYYVALVCAVLALYAVANLRDSRIGRAFAALRGSEIAASSLGVDVVRFKLLGFACAGALAGFGGALTLVQRRSIAPDQFNFIASLDILAIAVVGGLRSIGGAIASSLLFAVLVGEVFFRSPALADYLDLISGALLAGVLLFFQGGLGAAPERARGLWRAHLREPVSGVLATLRGHAAEPAGAGASVPRPADAGTPASPGSQPTPDAATDPGAPTDALEGLGDGEVAGMPTPDGRRLPLLLAARGITVRFGGLTAVNDATVEVGAGEIVGLIGANGAGKTTLFNSILGLNEPAAGRVELYGHDVTDWPVHRRAALGVGRTFQILQLFSDLTVFDNLLVATHLQNRTGLYGSLLVTRRARAREAEARARVRAVLRLMELERVADRQVAGLPFGVLRLIEVARTLVTGARLVCFDEPASGLDSRETDALIEWFLTLKRIGITLLVIEHDVDMVMRMCDFVYVLDQGRVIAGGTPAQVRRDPAVVAAYIGDEEVA